MICKICKQKITNSLTTWMVSRDKIERELQYLVHTSCIKEHKNSLTKVDK